MLRRALKRFWVLLAFIIYFPIYLIPLPPRWESHGIEITDMLLVLALCGFLYVAFTHEGGGWKALRLSAILCLVTIPLLRTWEIAESGHNLILGLLPFIDANGYYSDALRLIHSGLFEMQGVYRPLFSTFLAALLKIFGGNLQWTSAILVILYGLGVFALASDLRKLYGLASALILVLFLHFFYLQFAGSTMTEQLGAPLGMFGISALLQGVENRSKTRYLAGMFLVTFALTVRAGAYFALPALLLFGVFFFRETRREAIVFFVLSCLVIALPLGMDSLVRRWVAPSDAAIVGNFSFTLYGQATGGRGWRSVFADHPELSSVPLAEVGRFAYQYAFEEIRENPLGLIQGSFKSWRGFFTPAYLFDVFQTRNQTVNLFLQIPAFVLFLAGLWFAWRKRDQPLYALLLTGFLGIVLSVPFLPPFDGGGWWGGVRVHAATISLHLTITGVGLVEVLNFLPRPAFLTSQTVNRDSGNVFWAIGFGLALFTLAGAWAVPFFARQVDPVLLKCSEDETLVEFPFSPGSFIQIEADDSGLETYVPVVLIKHVERSMRDFPHGEFAFVPRRINQPSVFTVTVDILTQQSVWIVAPPELANLAGQIVTACGKRVEVWKAIELPLTVFYVSQFR